MAKAYETITEPMRRLIDSAVVFFVATAPSTAGHVNLSPKGYDTFTILDDRRVAYLDLTGSGAETIAHLQENGRITVMFCAFDGAPNIVRLYGTGTVIYPDDARFPELAAQWPPMAGTRAIIVVDVERTSSSCGYAVPRMDLVEDRDDLAAWAAGKSPDELDDYRERKNHVSIDGLPAVRPAAR